MLQTREFTNAELAELLEQLPDIGPLRAGIVAECVKRLRAPPAGISPAPLAGSGEMTDAQMLEAMQEQRDGAMALMFEERAKAVALREALIAMMKGSEYCTIMGYADWHKVTMPSRAALEKARAALSQGDVSGEGEGS